MFNFLKSTNQDKNLKSITLRLSGLHCTSCATNIDLTLEDLPGVINSSTNYAKSECKIKFNPNTTTLDQIKNIISSLDYKVTGYKKFK